MKQIEKEEKTDVMDIFNTWTDYSRSLENQINIALGESKAECEKIFNGWIDFSKSLEGKITPLSHEEKDSYKEFSNMWRNYNNKIGARLNNIVSENSAVTDNIIKMYKHSQIIMPNITKNSKPDVLMDFYVARIDFANEVASQIAKLITKSQEDNKKVTELWNDFTDRMNGLLDVLANRSEVQPNELLIAWSSTSVRFEELMTGFFKDYTTIYKDTYANWMNQTKDMQGQFANLTINFKTDYENIYQMYFERTVAIQKNLMLFKFPSTYALQNEISELRNKVMELEKNLNGTE